MLSAGSTAADPGRNPNLLIKVRPGILGFQAEIKNYPGSGSSGLTGASSVVDVHDALPGAGDSRLWSLSNAASCSSVRNPPK